MTVIRTINGSTLDFKLELAVPRGADAPYKLVHVTPEGNNVTEAEAKAACAMYPFVVLVKQSEPVEGVTSGALVCLEHGKSYQTQRGLNAHMDTHH